MKARIAADGAREFAIPGEEGEGRMKGEGRKLKNEAKGALLRQALVVTHGEAARARRISPRDAPDL